MTGRVALAGRLCVALLCLAWLCDGVGGKAVVAGGRELYMALRSFGWLCDCLGGQLVLSHVSHEERNLIGAKSG